MTSRKYRFTLGKKRLLLEFGSQDRHMDLRKLKTVKTFGKYLLFIGKKDTWKGKNINMSSKKWQLLTNELKSRNIAQLTLTKNG